VLAALAGGNLWATLAVNKRLADAQPLPAPPPDLSTGRQAPPTPPGIDETHDRFAEALHDLLLERMGKREWEQAQPVFLARYERAARARPGLRVEDANIKGKLAVGAVSVLSGRSADHVEDAVRKALANRGYDAMLIDAAAERVRQQILEDSKKDAP
jgi:hypothetical protein